MPTEEDLLYLIKGEVHPDGTWSVDAFNTNSSKFESIKAALDPEPGNGFVWPAPTLWKVAVVARFNDPFWLECTDTAATAVNLQVTGGAANSTLTYNTESVSITVFGFPNHSTAQAATAANKFLLVEGSISGGCFLADGGVSGILERLAIKAARTRQGHDNVFVNPYTFVPLPETVQREAPVGHAAVSGERWSGRLSVVFTAKTPVLIGRGSSAPTGLPGSGVKGAVRSVHEALAGGCLRVFDREFVPVYRDVLDPPTGWLLGQVSEVDADGNPMRITPTDGVLWVPHGLLAAAGFPTPKAGDLLAFDVLAKVTRHGREEATEITADMTAQPWLLMVSDAAARPAGHTYFHAAGRLAATSLPVASSVASHYRTVAEGARDVVLARQDPPVSPTLDVEYPDGTNMGTRQQVALLFETGDIVWIRVAQNMVAEIKQAAIWRHLGKYAAGERVPNGPNGTLACSDPKKLCPSCRLFGSVDDEGDPGRTLAEQRGYRGHVRFGTARTEAKPFSTRLAPLGTPRPGSGQFYLTDTDTRPTMPSRREWGSSPDNDERRQLRGRKFYWRFDPSLPNRAHPRYQPVDGQGDTMVGSAWLLPKGSELICDVWFENLDQTLLGGLLAALDPGSVLDDQVPPGFSEEATATFGIQLGGGKPLGLGSVSTSVTISELYKGSARYDGTGSTVGADLPEIQQQCIDEFVEGTYAKAGWRPLAAVLHDGHVNGARVSYPPNRRWDGYGQADFQPGYAFCQKSGGLNHGNQTTDFIPLPVADEPDQALDIIEGA